MNDLRLALNDLWDATGLERYCVAILDWLNRRLTEGD